MGIVINQSSNQVIKRACVRGRYRRAVWLAQQKMNDLMMTQHSTLLKSKNQINQRDETKERKKNLIENN